MNKELIDLSPFKECLSERTDCMNKLF